MDIINALGKPCPIPVVEAKKALAKQGSDIVLVKVDNITAVQNLEKLAKGYGYSFSYIESEKDIYEVTIALDGKDAPAKNAANTEEQPAKCEIMPSERLVVVISGNTMGNGDQELGKILIKGFIYSLTELAIPPASVIFLNSGAYLTSNDSNTIDDLKKLEEKGTAILTCGTCVNFYGLQDKVAVGSITDMYGITDKMATASNIINI